MAGSRDLPERRSGLCEAGPLLLFLCSHLLNIEPPRGDSVVSRFPSGRVSNVEGTGRAPDCDIAWDGPSGGASSSRESEEEARDSDSYSVNTETR